MNIKEILETIDLSKIEKDFVDVYDMASTEFDIHEYLIQDKDNFRLTYLHGFVLIVK